MAEQWVITPEERMKHDAQFSQLKPIDGYITGDQAKGFFMKSNLPPQTLYQIWALSDLNGDGKMDRKEFSIAVYLIQKKLQGRELPAVLPASLKGDPVTVFGGGGGGGSAFSQTSWSTSFGPTMAAPTASVMRPPVAVPPMTQPVPAVGMPVGNVSQWTMSQTQKLKYIQLFNTHDRMKKGFLTGNEARSILTQTGLPQNILAQIWNLADVDKDGKLTNDEFCLVMFFVEAARAGQVLPLQLPPDLVPPAFRGSATNSIPTAVPAPMMVAGGMMNMPQAQPTVLHQPNVLPDREGPPKKAAMKSDGFSDLLGGFVPAMPDVTPVGEPQVPMSPLKPVTFEDKRKENFDKGNAELERRRALLKEQQRREEEERMAKEREEQEMRERQRLEKERKKQLEYEQQMERLRLQELEKEEQRRKAVEQREAAKREMERQRQMEVERQQKQQMTADKMREQKLLEQATAALGEAKLEKEAMDSKKIEMMARIEQARRSVRDLTESIEQMRLSRDAMVVDIDRFQAELQTRSEKLNSLRQEKLLLERKAQQQTINADDSYKAVVHSHSSKQANIQKLKAQLDQLEKETEVKLSSIDKANSEAEELRRKENELDLENRRLREEVDKKAQEWEAKKNRENKNRNAANLSKDDIFAWGKGTAGVTLPKQPQTHQLSVKWPPQNGASKSEPTIHAKNNIGKAPVNNSTVKVKKVPQTGSKKYRALYAFEARNSDELTLNVGDIVWVSADQTGVEPGWLVGDSGNSRGWFPEAYVEVVMDDEVAATLDANSSRMITEQVDEEVVEAFRDEYSNITSPKDTAFSDNGFETSFTASYPEQPIQTTGSYFTAQAMFPWIGKKDNHLSFDKGDIITILEQQDVWWKGELNGKVGIFPKSYVKLQAAEVTNSNRSSQVLQPDVGNAMVQQQQQPLHSDCPLPGATALPEPETFVAQFPYISNEPTDLTFNINDTIVVTHKDEEWWYGCIGDRKGIFPANYVKKVEVSPGQTAAKAAGKKPEIAIVIAPYQATGPEQLSLQPNQLIQVRKKSPSGWWEGELQARGQKRKIGWFPANYVKLHNNPRGTPDSTQQTALAPPLGGFDNGSRGNSPVSYPAPTSAPAMLQVMALYKYAAQNGDELSFEKDSIINVLDKDDPDWWKGEVNGTVGLFPSNYVKQLDRVASSSDTDAKRQNVVQEFIDTEQSYRNDLRNVVEIYIEPMEKQGILNSNDLQGIFVNWKELIRCSEKFLRAFKVRRKTMQQQTIVDIGDILCANLSHMQPYVRFCSCHFNSTRIIREKLDADSKFRDFCKRAQGEPKMMGLPLSSYLVKPMQRITKYPLLIEKLIQYTPVGYADRLNLEEALVKANELCNQVNEGVREKENSDKLEWIQTHVRWDKKVTLNTPTNCLGARKYLYSGSLYKAKSGKELVGFLFNDFLLLTQPEKTLGNIASVFSFDISANIMFKVYREPILLNEVQVRKAGEADVTAFQLDHGDKSYVLKAINAKEKEAWMKLIDSASQEFIENARKRTERSNTAIGKKATGRLLAFILEGRNLIASDINANQIPPVGRVILVIMEGCHLVARSNGKSDPYCEVSLGPQELKTKVVNETLNPKWNESMQFIVRDIQQDILCITVYDKDNFTPDDFLGRTEIRVKDIYDESQTRKGPIVKRLSLQDVSSGEVIVKFDLQIFGQ